MTTLAHITDGVSGTNDAVISNSGWGTDTRGLIAVAAAFSATGTVAISATGGNVTWSEATSRAYRVRREIAVLESDGTPDGTDITISVTGSGSFAQMAFSIDEVAEWSGTGNVVNSISSNDVGTGSTTLECPQLAVISGDEIVYSTGACEGASVAFAADAGTNLHAVKTGGSDVRSFVTIDAGTDRSPGYSWNDSNVGAGVIAAKLSDGSTGAHAVAGGTSGSRLMFLGVS